MREDGPGPVGAVLVVPNVLLLAALAVEYIAVRPLFGAPASAWQNAYDSGSMAIVSLGPGLALLAVTLAVPVILVVVILAMALGRGRLTTLGWVALLVQLPFLGSIWVGPAVPGSTSEYWLHVAVWAGCAATGIIAGVSVRPPLAERLSTLG